jgi:hypothetical protein
MNTPLAAIKMAANEVFTFPQILNKLHNRYKIYHDKKLTFRFLTGFVYLQEDFPYL